MAKQREFVPINNIVGPGSTRSMLENMAHPGQVALIDKQPITSYDYKNNTHQAYSVISVPEGCQKPTTIAVAILRKITNAATGRFRQYKIIQLKL